MKIGIVNDSAIAVEALRRTLAQRPGLEVAWVAHDGAQAVSMCGPNPPDLVLMDLVMPVMDGVAATREIMRRTPCPILIVTSDVGHHASLVFDAMGAGALDAVDTPVLGAADMTRPASSLLAKIDAVAAQQADARKPALVVAPAAAAVSDALVAIGASAGGPAALATLLGRLPANFGAGVIVVQHVDDAFTPGMATWLDQQTALTVRLAKAGDRPTAGTVLLAGGNRHLRVDGSGRCTYSDEPKDAVYRPSIDVFLSSVAEHWRARAVGVLLTGMGRDGAAGLGDMRTRGFITIAQDRATSAVYGMPKAAAEAGAASEILPLPTIAPQLVALFGTV
ncbi:MULTISPECIES: chemotaxis response regulator protein-glutamate methylesterase [Pandoraea]|jgi:two-component system response regulator WspF|uniref:Protein-glutamate methylesterase/protein-glutamine glutaminase n=1 Tax=Pandoraea pnomenusa TaxID=93220 RepID=A0A378YQR9_9BURK|nr:MULTISPECIES: chemotaxis response regulator protein-glutamate methylesterase [Pandoraea]AHB07886.1 chemotaxis protein [Pandoraea pnomenusa 3kgm]AHB75919.1 chemotaxis response regulator protein-glutamate methylesterase [Pandoraea pnomenusa]AHN75753.1 chemotaxis response regulator protein-glutamate methylesterase [Pandoraea pnomenusa]AIU27651.1 chemotaxis response regulator protein-glutamate methylesterase [Pandoraea pnomenusa]ANC44801.1 chemotaxis response regulator protein-glutamate methyle